jgi:hypothetical protein
MKYVILLFFVVFYSTAIAQINRSNFVGHYRDYFGNHIDINSDSTFKYSYFFDLMSSWTRGTWRKKNDTIYLKTILIYDTLKYKEGNGKFVDSLVLSKDEKPELITSPDITGMFSAGGQNRVLCPNKLFFDNNKLFCVDSNGKLIKKKVKGFWTAKKWDPWYFKEVEK